MTAGTPIRRVRGALAVLIAGTAVLSLPAGVQNAVPASPQKPYYDYRERAQPYSGPGADEAEPDDLGEALIGYFGPTDPGDPLHGDLWLATLLAVEDVNAAGGCRGLPIRLLPAWSENPWGNGISKIARMVYEEPVWAVLGSVDGSSAHLVAQIAAKARLPQISSASVDRTANLANVPWTFSCLPGEQLQVPALILLLEERFSGRSLALVSGVDHDSRVFAQRFRSRLSARKVGLDLHLEFDPAAPLPLDLEGHLKRVDWGALVVLADPLASAAIVARLRRFYQGPVLGSSAFGRRAFTEATLHLGGELVFTFPASLEGVHAFSRRFEARFGRQADFAAAQAYDSVRLLCTALEKSGFNRVRLHDALRQVVPWEGLAGSLQWDRTGQNTRPVVLMKLESGEILPVKPELPFGPSSLDRPATSGQVPREGLVSD